MLLIMLLSFLRSILKEVMASVLLKMVVALLKLIYRPLTRTTHPEGKIVFIGLTIIFFLYAAAFLQIAHAIARTTGFA